MTNQVTATNPGRVVWTTKADHDEAANRTAFVELRATKIVGPFPKPNLVESSKRELALITLIGSYRI